MQFRVGHEVRYEVLLDATNAAEAERMAEQMPYEEWHHNYLTSQDVIAIDESPVNPSAE